MTKSSYKYYIIIFFKDNIHGSILKEVFMLNAPFYSITLLPREFQVKLPVN